VTESVYRVTELIGVSSESWEAAARNAIETAAKTLRDLRMAEADRFDVTIEDGTVKSYRVRLNVSFKYGPDDSGSRADQAEEWEHTRHELP
jgi:dodecin